jgi:hypothetical protein
MVDYYGKNKQTQMNKNKHKQEKHKNMKMNIVVLLLAMISSGQLAFSATCYGYYGMVPCGPAAGTTYTLCNTYPNVTVNARGSKPVWLASYSSSSEYNGLSGVLDCQSPITIYPCDGSPSSTGTLYDSEDTAQVPLIGTDSVCGG